MPEGHATAPPGLPAGVATAAAARSPVSLYLSASAFMPILVVVAVATGGLFVKYRHDSGLVWATVVLVVLFLVYLAVGTIKRIDLDTTSLTLVPLLPLWPNQRIPLAAIGAFSEVQQSAGQRWTLRRYGAGSLRPMLRAPVERGSFRAFGLWPQKALCLGMLYGPGPGLPALTEQQFIALVDVYRTAPLGAGPPYYPLGGTRARRVLVQVGMFFALLTVFVVIALFQSHLL